MKKSFIILTLSILIVGCGSNSVFIGKPQDCTVYEQYGATSENSYIVRHVPDPCLASDLITVAAKLPVIEWKDDYSRDFDLWAAKLEVVIAEGISLSALRDLVLIEVMKLNKKVGFTLLAISPIINSFYETAPMLVKDTEMLLALVKHLRSEVAQMAILAQ